MAGRKRDSLARILVIILALVMGLGLMGVGVSYWSDRLIIQGTLETGTASANITWCGGCTPSAIISCSRVDSDTLELIVADTAEVGPDYYCNFDIRNSGTLPLKIQSIVVVPDPPESGVVVGTTGVVAGTQIEPGVVTGGTVHVSLAEDVVGQFTFTVTFNVISWNQ